METRLIIGWQNERLVVLAPGAYSHQNAGVLASVAGTDVDVVFKPSSILHAILLKLGTWWVVMQPARSERLAQLQQWISIIWDVGRSESLCWKPANTCIGESLQLVLVLISILTQTSRSSTNSPC
eukprot:914870-Pelagomonas_calceolata.AAC.6